MLKRRRRAKHRVRSYVEETISLYRCDDFRDRFRIKRSTFEILLTRLAGKLLFTDKNVKVKISPEKQLLIFLKYVSANVTLQLLADLFGVGDTTVFHIIRRVSSLICDNLMNEMIVWPSEQKQKQIAHKFQENNGFPGIVGAIDGSHIPIKTPKEQHENYINRKGTHSVILQAVCDSEMHFIDLYCGWPGSVHDSRVFRNSPLLNKASKLDKNFHLIGDAAYPLQTCMLTPYKDNGRLNAAQRQYNFLHSSSRMVIERAFGSLKGRFRCLRFIDMFDLDCILKIVFSCCILHELCLQNDDAYTPDNEDVEEEINSFQYIFPEAKDGEAKRKRITEDL